MKCIALMTLMASQMTNHGSHFLPHNEGTAVPSMLPIDAWEFHTPISKPRFFLPNQLPIIATVAGQPVD